MDDKQSRGHQPDDGGKKVMVAAEVGKQKVTARKADVQFDLYAFPFENVVFEGGSNNLLAFVGAVRCLEEAGIWSRVVRLSGTGTGALVAALLSVGYTSQQLEQLLNFDLRIVTQDNCCGTCCLGCSMKSSYGWNPNKKITKWLAARLKEMAGNATITFLELFKKFNKELCVVVTNVSNGCTEYCHPKTSPHLSVIDAVRMTLATPGLCSPVKLRLNGRNQCFADGGIFCNYPVHCFDGWWLSQRREDNFLTRHALLNEQSRFTDDPTRFAKFNSKTLGFVVFDDCAHDMFTKQLDQRSGQLKAVVPDTALAKQWDERMKTAESACEVYASYTAAAKKFAKVLTESFPDLSKTLYKTDIDGLLRQNPNLTAADLKTLFGNSKTGNDIWTELKPTMAVQLTVQDAVSYLENGSFTRYRRCHQRFVQTEINSLAGYFETVQLAVHSSNSRPTTSKDAERTVGINCRYLGGFQTSRLTKRDQLFLVEQGHLSTKSYLENFVSVSRPPIKDSPDRSSFCRDDLPHFIDDDVSEIIDERDYMENAVSR